LRVRDHIAISTAAAAVLYPLVGRRVVGAWAGGVLIDCDHFLWFAVRHRSLDLAEAVRYFNDGRAPAHPSTKVFHSPLAVSLALLIGARQRAVLPIALGMAMHVAMDAYHESRMDRARAASLERDDFTCQECGSRDPDVTAHLRRQPWLLPSYRTENLITLCPACHRAAHARPTRSIGGRIPLIRTRAGRRGFPLPPARVSGGS